MDNSQGAFSPDSMINYLKTCQDHYFGFWQQGINCDVINTEHDFNKYKMLVVPMLYMYKENVANKLKQFTANGGVLITTYWSGITNQHDLCFLGGCPGDSTQEVVGLWEEEVDALYPEERKQISINTDYFNHDLNGSYSVSHLCGVVNLQGATPLAFFDEDYYKGKPAITVNNYQKGTAYYIGARLDEELMLKLYTAIAKKHNIQPVIDVNLPRGVTVGTRITDNNEDILFFQNFNNENIKINLKNNRLINLIDGKIIEKTLYLEPYS